MASPTTTAPNTAVTWCSRARAEATPSFDTYVKLRDQVFASGKLVPTETGYYRFTEDVEFTSPSAAASTVVGGNRNGREIWVTKTGETYGAIKQRQIEAAEGAAVTRGPSP